MAERFLAAGARVALLDIPGAGLQARCTAAGLPADRIAVLEADITSPESSKAAVEATVKRFFRENGRIRLQPENSAMEPLYPEHVQILGKVIGVFRTL